MTDLPITSESSTGRSKQVFRVLLVRFRFLLLISCLLSLIAFWPMLRNYWDKWTQSGSDRSPISSEIEYWCPMCPGVVSDWPNKCPVCNMSLIRRKKGEMTPLPDGVMARVQLSPYRIQLAGIQTALVEYRKLERDIIVPGILEASPRNNGNSDFQSHFLLTGEAIDREISLLNKGEEVSVTSDSHPGERFRGKILQIQPRNNTRSATVQIEVENTSRLLRTGDLCIAKFRYSLTKCEGIDQLLLERCRNRLAAESVASILGNFYFGINGPLLSLLDNTLETALFQQGGLSSIPSSSVIDTGKQQIVFVQHSSGIFDARIVSLGRRSGDYYPIRSGLQAGDRVVVEGALLLDAETRLNPSLAASYFGAGNRGTIGSTDSGKSPTRLSPEEKLQAEKQKVCPVTGGGLYSMGGPVRVTIAGRTLFICCDGCEDALREHPSEYLSKLPK